MIIRCDAAEKRTALKVAEAMITAARTAPKGCGVDNIVTLILDGEDKDKFAEEMKKFSASNDVPFFGRDGDNILNSHCLVLIGVTDSPLGLPGCGNCGFKSCADMCVAGGRCAFNITDLGIAVGSAVSIAADNRIDNRVFFSAGKIAVDLGLLGNDVKVAYGIPLSTTGKNPCFDRDPSLSAKRG